MNNNIDFIELRKIYSKNELYSIVNKLDINNIYFYQSILQQAVDLRSIDIELSTLLLLKAQEANYGEGRVFTELCFNNFELDNINYYENAGISCLMLGSYGRFGNQILQYITITYLSEILNLPAYMPKWIGNFIFNTKVDHNIPIYTILESNLIKEIFERKIVASNFDIGTFMVDLNYLKAYKSEIINLIKINSNLNLLSELNDFGFHPESSLTIHLRLTDFTSLGYNCDLNILIQWLDNYINLYKPENLWLVTDDLSSIDIFNKKLEIKSLSRYKKRYQHIDFLYDWQLLLNSSNVVANAESTFSLTANFLSPNKQNLFYLNKNGSVQLIN
jgi:hypothetical protein